MLIYIQLLKVKVPMPLKYYKCSIVLLLYAHLIIYNNKIKVIYIKVMIH